MILCLRSGSFVIISESHKTKSQLLSALCVIGNATSGQKDLHRQLVDIATQVGLTLISLSKRGDQASPAQLGITARLKGSL